MSMTKRARKRTDEKEIAFLEEIRAFSRALHQRLKRMPSPPSDERRGISGASAQVLLEDSLEWVKRFLVDKHQREAMSGAETGEQAYELWLFSSCMASQQGLTIRETDFDALFEFFFWWYPRQCEGARKELTERLFASLSDLFAFLRREGAIESDQFMRDFLPLEDEALRLLDLYRRLDPDSPYFVEQFNALFGLEPPLE